MLELLLALLMVVLLGGSAALLSSLSWEVVFGAGVLLTAVGIGLGAPLGWGYHVALYRCLAPRDALPRRWWLRPTALHGGLSVEERRRVMPWFLGGAIACAVALLGCALLVIGALWIR